ncbi:MAG: NAD(+)/NADH kinase [Chlamydiales bacterium]
MIIALFTNNQKVDTFGTAIQVRDFLQKKNIHVVAPDAEAKSLGVGLLSSISPKQIDFLISMGGDGTILRIIHHYPEIKAPVLGINMGHLGFMADVPLSDLFPSLEEFVLGEYEIQERLMMEGVAPGGHLFFAVNDIVVHRAKNPSIIDLSIHVDGTYLNTFSADGIILSTASGSTAYSLAAGGPILSPELDSIVITPISPHTISNRPIVIRPKKQIEVEYLSPYDPVEITYDGVSRYSMPTNEIFRATIANKCFRMVKLRRTDYFATLRTKLGWSGQVRYGRFNDT